MKKSVSIGRIVGFSMAVCAMACSLALAEGPAKENKALEGEIGRLAVSLGTLEKTLADHARAMDQQLVLQRLNTAISYLNFRSRKIELLERDVQKAQGVKDRLEDVLLQLDKREEQMESDARSSLGGVSSDLQREKTEFEQQRKLFKQRVARIDSEIVDLEIQISELQSQIDSVERFVEENLAL